MKQCSFLILLLLCMQSITSTTAGSTALKSETIMDIMNGFFNNNDFSAETQSEQPKKASKKGI